jgi:hypothetical protein
MSRVYIRRLVAVVVIVRMVVVMVVVMEAIMMMRMLVLCENCFSQRLESGSVRWCV